MPQVIKSFRATHYNPAMVRNHSQVACPPYDVISKQELKILRKKSPYNFSRILLADKNNYEAKRQTLDAWSQKGILIDDSCDSLYLYEQKFKVNGKPIVRFGIISLLKMDKKGIFPHERTHKAPKEDRKRIIKAVEANLSPIFVIATSRISALGEVHKAYRRRKPFLSCKDKDGNANRIWKIQEKGRVARLCKEFAKAKLVIADGHHRFEISWDYFKKNKHKFKDLNYLMTYITDRQKGLVILPTHRVVSIGDTDDEFFDKLGKYFTIQAVSQNILKRNLESSNTFCLGVYRSRRYYFLELKDKRILAKIPNALYRELDPYVFHKLVLPLFNIQDDIEYTHSISEARALAGRAKVAFLLRVASLDSVIRISSRGFRLPQKSTYFYPKLLSGLVVRRFSK